MWTIKCTLLAMKGLEVATCHKILGSWAMVDIEKLGIIIKPPSDPMA